MNSPKGSRSGSRNSSMGSMNSPRNSNMGSMNSSSNSNMGSRNGSRNSTNSTNSMSSSRNSRSGKIKGMYFFTPLQYSMCNFLDVIDRINKQIKNVHEETKSFRQDSESSRFFNKLETNIGSEQTETQNFEDISETEQASPFRKDGSIGGKKLVKAKQIKTKQTKSQKKPKLKRKVGRKRKGGSLQGIKEYIKSIWHLFDKHHDFGVIDESVEIKSSSLHGTYGDVLDYLDAKNKVKTIKEGDIVEYLLSNIQDDNGQKLKFKLIYSRIYLDDEYAIVSKGNKTDDNVSEFLKSYIYPNGNDTNSNKYIIDTNIHIELPGDGNWRKFKTNILGNIGKDIAPFEKVWDPHGPYDPNEEGICHHDILQRVNKVYNNPDSEENDAAFRKLTRDFFEIRPHCNNNKYDGIHLIFKKLTNETLSKYYSNEFVDIFGYLSVVIDDNGFVFKNNGFSIPNVSMVIDILDEYRQEINTIEEFLLNYDQEYVKEILSEKVRKKSKSKSGEESFNEDAYKKTLLLLLICYIYINESIHNDKKIIDKLIDILYDFKKSGDWGQVTYCDKMKETPTCFISGDMFSCFYAILCDVTTMFSNKDTLFVESNKKYCDIAIYKASEQNMDYNYIRNVMLNFTKNYILRLKILDQIQQQSFQTYCEGLDNYLKNQTEKNLQKIYELFIIKKYDESLLNEINYENEGIQIIFHRFLNFLTPHVFETNVKMFQEYFYGQFSEINKEIKDILNDDIIKNRIIKTMNLFKETLSDLFDYVYMYYIFCNDDNLLLAESIKTFQKNMIGYYFDTQKYIKVTQDKLDDKLKKKGVENNGEFELRRTTARLPKMKNPLYPEHINLNRIQLILNSMISANTSDYDSIKIAFSHILDFYRMFVTDMTEVFVHMDFQLLFNFYQNMQKYNFNDISNKFVYKIIECLEDHVKITQIDDAYNNVIKGNYDNNDISYYKTLINICQEILKNVEQYKNNYIDKLNIKTGGRKQHKFKGGVKPAQKSPKIKKHENIPQLKKGIEKEKPKPKNEKKQILRKKTHQTPQKIEQTPQDNKRKRDDDQASAEATKVQKRMTFEHKTKSHEEIINGIKNDFDNKYKVYKNQIEYIIKLLEFIDNFKSFLKGTNINPKLDNL